MGSSLTQTGPIPSSAEHSRCGPSAIPVLPEHALGYVLAPTSFKLVKTPSQLHTADYLKEKIDKAKVKFYKLVSLVE